MYLAEKHIIKYDLKYDLLCNKSKTLYNYCNQVIRDIYFAFGKMPSYFDLQKVFCKYKQPDYKNLPPQTSNYVIKSVIRCWKAYFTFKKKKDPKAKLPHFKNKETGRHPVTFSSQQLKIKDGFINFPKFSLIPPLKTKANNIVCVTIIPMQSCFCIDVCYKKEKIDSFVDYDKFMSIDLGVNNLASIVTNSEDDVPLLVSGKIIKSINQFYNKKISAIKSELRVKNGKYTSKRIKRLVDKRNFKISDILHKSSKFIIDHAKKNKIATIIIGHNKDWKKNVNMGKVQNQNFVSIPHFKFITQIKYKAMLNGIQVIENEESYTSKCDSLSLEKVCFHKKYRGKRIKRGLFKSSVGRVVNADINGALNIMRKVINDSIVFSIIDRGLVHRPIKVKNFNKPKCIAAKQSLKRKIK